MLKLHQNRWLLGIRPQTPLGELTMPHQTLQMSVEASPLHTLLGTYGVSSSLLNSALDLDQDPPMKIAACLVLDIK